MEKPLGAGNNMAVYFILLRLIMPFLKIELAMLFFYNGLANGGMVKKQRANGKDIFPFFVSKTY